LNALSGKGMALMVAVVILMLGSVAFGVITIVGQNERLGVVTEALRSEADANIEQSVIIEELVRATRRQFARADHRNRRLHERLARLTLLLARRAGIDVGGIDPAERFGGPVTGQFEGGGAGGGGRGRGIPAPSIAVAIPGPDVFTSR
jgi:hypothetical protein